MPHSDAYWREFLRRYNPYRVLAPAEVRSLYAAREEAPHREIARFINRTAEPRNQRVILAGTRGTGKTTELMQTFVDLGEDAGKFIPVYADISAAFTQATGTLPIMALMALSIRGAANDWNAPPIGGNDNLATALQAFGIAPDVLVPLAKFVAGVTVWWQSGGTMPDHVLMTGANAYQVVHALSELTRGALNRPVDDADDGSRSNARALLEAVQGELVRLEEASGRIPVLLIDGLDKRQDIDEIDQALHDVQLLLELPAAIVLSGPMPLRTDPRFAASTLPGSFRAVTLHNVPVVNMQTGKRRQDGVDVLLDLFQQRAAETDAFDFAGLMSSEQVQVAAQMSSGVIREFLLIISRVGEQVDARDGVVATDDDLNSALKHRKHDMQSALNSDDWNLLAKVLKTGELRGGDSAERLLLTNFIACYPNGDVRFRPNELLIDYLEQRARPNE